MALNENSRQQPLKYLAASNRVSVLNANEGTCRILSRHSNAEILISFVGGSRAFQTRLFINFIRAKLRQKRKICLATSYSVRNVRGFLYFFGGCYLWRSPRTSLCASLWKFCNSSCLWQVIIMSNADSHYAFFFCLYSSFLSLSLFFLFSVFFLFVFVGMICEYEMVLLRYMKCANSL